MIETYDWILHAARDSRFKAEIENALSSKSSTEMTHMNRYWLIFDSDERFVSVSPISSTDAKIIPQKISYRAVSLLINGDWDCLEEADIKDSEEICK